MKSYSTLPEIVEYIRKSHRFLFSGNGIYGIKLLRKPNGKRIIFEEINGLKLSDIQVQGKNSLSLEQIGMGLQFKNNIKHIYKATTFLQDLVCINVYDERTEFFTVTGVDFSYLKNEYTVNIKMLKEWVNDDCGILRAQWIHDDPEVQKLLDEIGGDRSVKVSNTLPRNINMKGIYEF